MACSSIPKIGGLGVCSTRKFLKFITSEMYLLVASETTYTNELRLSHSTISISKESMQVHTVVWQLCFD